MDIKDLSEEEMDKYDSALVAILEKIRIIHALGLERQLLNDLKLQAPEQLNTLVAIAMRMDIGHELLYKNYR